VSVLLCPASVGILEQRDASVHLSHGAAAQAIGMLAACSLATAGHQRCTDCRCAAIFGSNCHRRGHIVSPPPCCYLTDLSEAGPPAALTPAVPSCSGFPLLPHSPTYTRITTQQSTLHLYTHALIFKPRPLGSVKPNNVGSTRNL